MNKIKLSIPFLLQKEKELEKPCEEMFWVSNENLTLEHRRG